MFVFGGYIRVELNVKMKRLELFEFEDFDWLPDNNVVFTSLGFCVCLVKQE